MSSRPVCPHEAVPSPDQTDTPEGEARALLASAGIRPTTNRLAVLAAVLAAPGAVTAPELEAGLTNHMNRVTLYRTLDLFAEQGVLLRTQGSERTFQYCRGRGHGHFHCRCCGRTQCVELALPQNGSAINPLALALHLAPGLNLEASGPKAVGGRIEAVDIRLDGICRDCLRADTAQREKTDPFPSDPKTEK